MDIEPQRLLNLIRISDTFFPVGSFTISQGAEQLVADGRLDKNSLPEVLRGYVDHIWRSFDIPIFYAALEAAHDEDLETILLLDDLCFASKITEESRSAMIKMGANLVHATELNRSVLGSSYASKIERGEARGTYPVVLAMVSHELNLGEQAAASLIYMNMIEIVAALVRMTEIDYLEAQEVMINIINDMSLETRDLADVGQSFPLVDIGSMRHEHNRSRMFIS